MYQQIGAGENVVHNFSLSEEKELKPKTKDSDLTDLPLLRCSYISLPVSCTTCTSSKVELCNYLLPML